MQNEMTSTDCILRPLTDDEIDILKDHFNIPYVNGLLYIVQWQMHNKIETLKRLEMLGYLQADKVYPKWFRLTKAGMSIRNLLINASQN